MGSQNSSSGLYPGVFSPLKIRELKFRNRLFFPSFGIDMANTDGCFSADLLEFYQGISESGCGFLLLGNSSVSPESILQLRGLRMYDANHSQAVVPLIEHARRVGTVVGIQLQHYGFQATTEHVGSRELLSPSGIGSSVFKQMDPNYVVREMTLADIEVVKGQFARSASLAYAAGARLIQLQASNGYLLSSFMSPNSNKRLDGYGGSLLKRARFLVEIVQSVRRAIGEGAVLSVRLGADDGIGDTGTVPSDFEHIVPMLERCGVDMFEISIGTAETAFNTGRTPEMIEMMASVVRTIKGFASVPVGFAGLIDGLSEAERIISSGAADFVGLGRALFADNDLIHKTLEGQDSTIFHCRWDGRCSKDKFNSDYSRVYCCVNPKYLRPTQSKKETE
jgi:2,4-dienoyl-CoA reductase-like NADH-dependent reductase (Old Yellow Enzyme family)